MARKRWLEAVRFFVSRWRSFLYVAYDRVYVGRAGGPRKGREGTGGRGYSSASQIPQESHDLFHHNSVPWIQTGYTGLYFSVVVRLERRERKTGIAHTCCFRDVDTLGYYSITVRRHVNTRAALAYIEKKESTQITAYVPGPKWRVCADGADESRRPGPVPLHPSVFPTRDELGEAKLIACNNLHIRVRVVCFLKEARFYLPDSFSVLDDGGDLATATTTPTKTTVPLYPQS